MKGPFRTAAKTTLLVVALLLAMSCAVPPAASPQPAGEEPTATEPEEAVAEKITVIMPRHEADIVGAFPERVSQFTEETGIEVELIQLGWDEVADKVIPEMASGGDAYDVTEFDNGWVAQWCGAGWATPLDQFMPEGYTEDMIPGLVDLFTCPDGKLYGIVWNNDTRFFYYNSQMLEEAGIDAPPETWSEMVEQTRTMQDQDIAEHGLAPYWKMEWALANEFHFWTYTFGGEIVDEDGCFLWNTDPKTQAALEFMRSLIEQGVADPAALTYDQEASQDVFLKGGAAFFPQGWGGLIAFSNDPEVSDIVGDAKIGLVPKAEGGSTATLTLPEAYAIPAGSQNKEAAWEFIRYMTSKETNRWLAEQIGLLPIWTDLYTDPELVEQYPHWEQFSEQLETARGLTQVTWYGDFVDVAIAEIQKALAGEKSAEAALNDMASQLEEFECTP